MSGKLVRQALDYLPEDLTHVQVLVYITLAESARDKAANGIPARLARFHVTVDEIAHKVRAKPGTVKNALGALARRGLIVRQIDHAHEGTAQNYELPPLGAHHRTATHPTARTGGQVVPLRPDPPHVA